jgi:hypothetical protein
LINTSTNSVLARVYDVFDMDPLLFSGIRLASGAAMVADFGPFARRRWPKAGYNHS